MRGLDSQPAIVIVPQLILAAIFGGLGTATRRSLRRRLAIIEAIRRRALCGIDHETLSLDHRRRDLPLDGCRNRSLARAAPSETRRRCGL